MQNFTYILIPGAGGSTWYWHLVAPKLQELGHEAVPVQLPAADDRAGLPEYAATVVRAIGNRDPARVALVAQSLAGFTVPLVCKEVSVGLLVLVNAMIPTPGETPGEWWGNTGHGKAKRRQNLRDGRRADSPFDPIIDFFHDVPQSVVDKAWALRLDPPRAGSNTVTYGAIWDSNHSSRPMAVEMIGVVRVSGLDGRQLEEEIMDRLFPGRQFHCRYSAVREYLPFVTI